MKKRRKHVYSSSPFERLIYNLRIWENEKNWNAYSSSTVKPDRGKGGKGRENLPDKQALETARELELFCKRWADKIIEAIDEWLGESNV